jgi:hypothetical protein
MLQNFKDDGLDLIGSNITCQIYLFIFVTIDKFDLNPMFVNINKLKPYRFIEDKTLQHVVVKPSDLAIDEHVQTKKPKPLPSEHEDL